VEAGHVDEAALIAWSLVAGRSSCAPAILALVRSNPLLAKRMHQDLPKRDSDIDKLTELRRLAAGVAASVEPVAEDLEQLIRLAAEIASESRARSALRADRIDELARRLAALLPDLDGLATTSLPRLDDDELGRIESTLEALQAARSALEESLAAAHVAL